VLGSSSLLASRPELGAPGRALELSLDADLLIEPCDARQAGVVHEAIGEGSLFHREYGVYADVMRPEIAATLPAEWEKRCVCLGRDRAVRCLNPIDLAVVKLQLGRDKDIALLKAMLSEGVISIAALRQAYQAAAMSERAMFKAGRILRQLEVEQQAGGATPPGTPPVVREARAKYGRVGTGAERRQSKKPAVGDQLE